MKRKRKDLLLHATLIVVLGFVMLPFALVVNNSFRSNVELYHSLFGLPKNLKLMVKCSGYKLTGRAEEIVVEVPREEGEAAGAGEPGSHFVERKMAYGEAMNWLWRDMTKGYRYGWEVLRTYMLNTLFVVFVTVFFVCAIGSIAGYAFSRLDFPGRKILFVAVLSFMMIPGVLMLVPSFMWVKKLGLLNSHWVLILPYVSGGQVFAIFLFKSFFDGLPEELFDAARIDGAGRFAVYWHMVLPLSKQIFAVVMIVNILGAWNNFIWPFVTNTNPQYHVIASGLFAMTHSEVARNYSTLFASYILSSIPLMLLFIYATKPFMRGLTSGAFKA